MLVYQYNPDVIRIRETMNGDDIQFQIHILKENPYVERMERVYKWFDNNEVYTDALFYFYANHEYMVIVRRDYYVDFVLELMKHRLLQKVEWTT